jgi:fructokinase
LTVVSIGEILWDLIGGGEFLGGAPFNLCVHLAKLGHDSYFVSAVGRDERGRRATTQAAAMGVNTRFLLETDRASTGISAVTLDSEGQASHNLPRPAAYDFLNLDHHQRGAIQNIQPRWICFGTLAQMRNGPRTLTEDILQDNPDARRFYDMNLRPRCWTPELVSELMHQADAVKLNLEEATTIGGLFDWPTDSLARFSELAASRFVLELVCVTCADEGCSLWRNDSFVQRPGIKVDVADTVGAGDAFAAALLHGLDQEWPLAEIATFANSVGAIVASRPGATPEWTKDEARAQCGTSR